MKRETPQSWAKSYKALMRKLDTLAIEIIKARRLMTEFPSANILAPGGGGGRPSLYRSRDTIDGNLGKQTG